MKFDSKTGALNGAKSKRGKSKLTMEVKERLADMEQDVFDALREGIKQRDFSYIKLWFNYRYGLPKQVIEDVTEVTAFNPVQITVEDAKTIRKALEDKY